MRYIFGTLALLAAPLFLLSIAGGTWAALETRSLLIEAAAVFDRP